MNGFAGPRDIFRNPDSVFRWVSNEPGGLSVHPMYTHVLPVQAHLHVCAYAYRFRYRCGMCVYMHMPTDRVYYIDCVCIFVHYTDIRMQTN